MKKLTWLVVIVSISGLLLSACESCKKGAKAPAEGEVVIEETVEEVVPKGDASAIKISDSLSTALCKKMVACSPEGPLTEEECIAQTKTSLIEALAEKPLNITEAQLTACVDSINGGTCEEVLGAEPPKGCEFLK